MSGDEDKRARLEMAQFCEQKLKQDGEIMPARMAQKHFDAIIDMKSSGRVR